MMAECKGDDFAFPQYQQGLTKREYFAAKMLASLMPIAARDGDDIIGAVRLAVLTADRLIAELNRKAGE
jgi:hypothetical protein